MLKWRLKVSNAKPVTGPGWKRDRIRVGLILATKEPSMISWRAKGALVVVDYGEAWKPGYATVARAAERMHKYNGLLEIMTPALFYECRAQFDDQELISALEFARKIERI